MKNACAGAPLKHNYIIISLEINIPTKPEVETSEYKHQQSILRDIDRSSSQNDISSHKPYLNRWHLAWCRRKKLTKPG